MNTLFFIIVILAAIWLLTRNKTTSPGRAKTNQVDRMKPIQKASEPTHVAYEESSQTKQAAEQMSLTYEFTLDENASPKGHKIPRPPEAHEDQPSIRSSELSSRPGNRVAARDITLDGHEITERSYRIPSREESARVHTDYGDINLATNTYFHDSADWFLKDARQNEHRTHPPTPHVPFQAYRTSHRDMNTEQAKWFYYWRNEIRTESGAFEAVCKCQTCLRDCEEHDWADHLVALVVPGHLVRRPGWGSGRNRVEAHPR